MAREVISSQELTAKLNEHMRGLHACRNLIASVKYDHAQIHGCNWQSDIMRRSGDAHDEVECNDAIRGFLATMHSRYDILP